MQTPVQNWAYRAINSEGEIVEGESKAASFSLLAVNLRMKGLQVISAATISDNNLQKLKNVVDAASEPQKPTAAPTIRQYVKALIRLLWEG